MCVYVYVYMYVHVHVCVCAYVYVCVCVCVCVCVYVRMFVFLTEVLREHRAHGLSKRRDSEHKRWCQREKTEGLKKRRQWLKT
jgi:hypothetical protein